MAKTTGSSTYVPGVCNIGPAERRMRRLVGIFGSIATVITFVLLLVSDAHWAWRLILIIPATMAATGFLQDRLHFCVGFGMQGLFNVINSAGVTNNVELEEFRQQDRRKAISILSYSFAIGLVVTAASLLF
ncbi:hypothetical protein H7200_02015 [Candidatus Saccharibacteria bacterium]|nr:hypothetical protein [Candidatus Saccharibacteria bacterium]